MQIFQQKSWRTCGIAYCDIFHQKAYIMFNEYVQLQQRRGNKPYNIPLITRPSILKANKQKLIPTRFQNKKTS